MEEEDAAEKADAEKKKRIHRRRRVQTKDLQRAVEGGKRR